MHTLCCSRMDSELLSVFHDDQYESSLNRYEENFWSVGNCDSFAPHLSENLNGILPISPIEEKLTYFGNDLQIDHYSNNDLCKNEHIDISDQSQGFMLENFIESGPTIEIISVDPNAKFEDDGEFDSSDSDKNEYKQRYCQSLSDDDNQSHATFRSRTESSSIGDYESHSSDESDFEDSNECNVYNQTLSSENISPILNKITVETKLDNKNNVYSNNNTVISHIDFIEGSIMVATNNLNESIEIDTENFDLATFITEDNFIPEKLTEYSSNDKNFNKKNNGYESEEIVDIETVDDNNVKKYSQIKREHVAKSIGNNNSNLCTNNLFEEDDVEKDPSWDPNCKKKIKSVDKIIEKPSVKVMKNHQTKKLKTHNNLSIRKKLQKTMQISDKNISFFNQLSARFNENKTNIKKEEKINPENELETNITKLKNKDQTIIEKLNLSQENVFQKDEIEKEKTNICVNKLSGNEVPAVPIKKKLNLEEYYKKRKGDLSVNSLTKDSKITSESKVSQLKKNIESNDHNPKNNSKSLLIAKDLSLENICRTELDPITEVKNKILRMQEMRKRAAQKRLIDIAVSSKVGPITKILPLEEIIKSNSNQTYPQKYINNSTKTEYEEIIIVSVSCNTDIKIPPKFHKTIAKNNSTSLLYNISHTIEKVKSNENLKISNNSLITSIKNVVLQKTIEDVQPINKNNFNKQNSFEKVKHMKNNIINENIIDEHGEDKIIMHLPKNRLKQKTCSISTQTEMLPEFPLLELVMPIKLIRNPSKNRKYRHKNGELTSMSSNSEKESDDEYNKMRSNRYRSNSRSTCGSRHISPSENYNYNSSDIKLKDISCTINKECNRSRRKLRQNINRNRNYSGSGHSTSSNYRSRSSSSFSAISRSRSRSRSSERKYRKSTSNYYKKSRSKTTNRENSPAVEERRIVYVGRIEAETSKEDLKRKFIGYGPIKQITLHYKDTGMKYGFVTFERAEDAFKAIDNGNTDLKINMYDISFGGRRAFCRQSYADLDGAATNTFQHYSYNSVSSSRNSVISNNEKDDSFESLLKKVKEKLCASKSSTQKT